MSVTTEAISRTGEHYVREASKKMGRPPLELARDHTVALKLDDKSMEILAEIASMLPGKTKPGRVASDVMNDLLKMFPLDKLRQELEAQQAQKGVQQEAWQMAS